MRAVGRRFAEASELGVPGGTARAAATTRTPRARRERAGEGYGRGLAGKRPARRGEAAERFTCELARPVRSIHAGRRGDRREAPRRPRLWREDRRGRFRWACPRPVGAKRLCAGGRPRGAGWCGRPPFGSVARRLTFSAQTEARPAVASP